MKKKYCFFDTQCLIHLEKNLSNQSLKKTNTELQELYKTKRQQQQEEEKNRKIRQYIIFKLLLYQTLKIIY